MKASESPCPYCGGAKYDEAKRLREQNADLLAALKRITNVELPRDIDHAETVRMDMLDIAYAAIKTAERTEP